MNSIFWQRENDYTNNEIFLTDEEMINTEINMGDYEIKFAFGVDVREIADFDITNNPYIEIKGYEWDITKGPLRYIETESCSEAYLNALISQEMRPYYPEPVCLKDNDNFVVRSSYETSGNAIHAGWQMFYCLNTTANGNWCKSKDEVDAWSR